MKAVVYWIRHKDHINPYEEGYIGVTVNFDRRIKSHFRFAEKQKHLNEHLQKNLLSDNTKIDILYEGEEDFSYEIEKHYRPNLCIGWNLAKGGGEGGVTRTGYKLSEEFRDKRRSSMLGNKIASGNKGKTKSEDHRKKISQSSIGRPKTKEQKKKQSEAMIGRNLTNEHRDKIRQSLLGKKRGPYKKKVDDYVAI